MGFGRRRLTLGGGLLTRRRAPSRHRPLPIYPPLVDLSPFSMGCAFYIAHSLPCWLLPSCSCVSVCCLLSARFFVQLGDAGIGGYRVIAIFLVSGFDERGPRRPSSTHTHTPTACSCFGVLVKYILLPLLLPPGLPPLFFFSSLSFCYAPPLAALSLSPSSLAKRRSRQRRPSPSIRCRSTSPTRSSQIRASHGISSACSTGSPARTRSWWSDPSSTAFPCA